MGQAAVPQGRPEEAGVSILPDDDDVEFCELLQELFARVRAVALHHGRITARNAAPGLAVAIDLPTTVAAAHVNS
jgi:hypothetical protein